MSYQGQEMRLGTAFDITERKIADERLRSLTSELISTEERERRRVAIFLHDVVGQALALCKMKIRSMQKSGSSASEDPGLQEILSLVDDSIKNTRSLTFDLSPPLLYELSFPVALRSLTEQLLDQQSIQFDFGYDGAPITLNDETKVITYHVVREVVINCVKHAQATHVSLNLAVRDTTLLIVVADDGVGLKTECKQGTPGSQGFGLFNIRERLAGLGASLEISSRQGQGTRVTISIPMNIPTAETNEHHSKHENTHHTGRRS
jgi:signal transduction histidine kinase